MSDRRRVLLASVGLAGHAFPVLALARALSARGHQVRVETSERWRPAVEELGAQFTPAIEAIQRPGGADEASGTSVAEAARAILPAIADFRPDAFVGDLFTLAPALAAELAGVPGASLIHHPYPVVEPGWPPFPAGYRRPRTPLGTLLWRGLRPALDPRHHRGRAELNRVRAELGLPAQRRFFGALSERLALVATFPQLEYPRAWPERVRVIGPLLFEPAAPEIEPPPGDGPLVVVAASSGQEPRRGLIATALAALADEPVRVLATTGGGRRPLAAPPNAVVGDWLALARAVEGAALMITNGGHGTVATALAAGVPVLVCPAGADQPENGIRVSWAGAGRMLPRRLLSPGRLRTAARLMLAERHHAERARELAAWARAHDPAVEGARLVERLAAP